MLKIENLKKSYKKKAVLNGVNLNVEEKCIKALIGVNGAGKSTLVDIICGIKTSDSGSVVVAGIDTKDKKSRTQIKKIIGYMPQNFSLFDDLNVKENLHYISALFQISPSRIDEVIELCYLQEHTKTLARNLSGGYKQLLSMASCILHNPKLLILDEPTSAMDPLFRSRFWEIVKRINKAGTTILLITHYLEELLECDSFACLSNGIITYSGKVEEFKEKGFINISEILNKFGA